jgi:LacI family transcriptional regulator
MLPSSTLSAPGGTTRISRPKRQRVCMADIARAEGVSITAVSYVINGRGDAMRIPAKTQRRILARCKKMNYSRDYLAAAMASRRTQTIGVLFTNALGSFMNDILWGIHEALRENDQEVLLCLSEDDVAAEAADIAMLEHRHVDGIIAFPVISTEPAGTWDDIVGRGAPPVVFVDNLPCGLAGDCVRIDDFAAGRSVVDKIVAEGLREAVVVMPDKDALTLQERVAGFIMGAERAGLKILGSFVNPPDPALLELLARQGRPLAFFSPQGAAMIPALREAFARQQLDASHMFITVGEVPESAFLHNRWWMLRQAGREMGRVAAQMLLARIAGATAEKSSTLLSTSWVCNRHPETSSARPL